MPAAQSQTQSKARRSSAKTTAPADAIALLKNDHREVEAWFEEFESTNSAAKKQKLANQICTALKVHTQIEEEIFYPACREAGVEAKAMDEADIEHEHASMLVEEIEAGKPGDDYYDARMKVLSEMVKHHVKEEEKRDGIFAQAKQSDLDLVELGLELQERKDALMKEQRRQ
jgi:hemerythrin superfamily protein